VADNEPEQRSDRSVTAMQDAQPPHLKRALNPMPDSVRQALELRGLIEAYERRPPYQRNDYLGWIGRAKQELTYNRRLEQMLDELAAGDRYMHMKWHPQDGEGG
jgi:uncharacterized protein YdeI (YjbR/CyaY-like superfamily)